MLAIAAPCVQAQAQASAPTQAAAARSPAERRNLQVQGAPGSGPAQPGSAVRVALVIGNAAYPGAALANPVNDARAVAQALRAAGFSVITRENTDQRTLLAALREFGDRLQAGGAKGASGAVGLFYFAGHGMQIKGRNYLIPVGSAIEREDEVADSAVDAGPEAALWNSVKGSSQPVEIGVYFKNYPNGRFAADGALKLNGGLVGWTAAGAGSAVRRPGGFSRDYSPAFQWRPATLAAGHAEPLKHNMAWRNADGKHGVEDRDGTLKVLARESVKVPAGEFDAWKIEYAGFVNGKNLGQSAAYAGRFKETYWYVPALRNFVASEYEERASNLQIRAFERHELTSFSVRGAEHLAQR